MSIMHRRYVWIVACGLIGVVMAGVFAGPLAAQVKAALVRDVENPDQQQLFNDSLFTDVSAGVSFIWVCSNPVPAGKRLVVEHVSAQVVLGEGEIPLVQAYTFTNTGQHAIHVLAASFLGDNAFAGASVWETSHPLILRAEPGEMVCFSVERETAVSGAVLRGYVTGYFVKYP